MKAIEWKQKQIEHAQLGRAIRDAVARAYLVPSFHEEAIISTAIAIEAADMAEVKVRAVHSHGVIRRGLLSPITDVEALDVFTLEALARTKREVDKWYHGERDELPTADELGLLDPETYSGPAHVIGMDSAEPAPTKPRPPTKVHEVTDDTRLPPKGE